MKDEIARAVEVLKKGGVIVYPTDTVWGVGCDATNEEAVARVYALKKSHDKHAMTVLVARVDDVGRYVKRVPEVAWDLLELSDTPLTLILPGGCGVAQNLVPDAGTIGIRVPRHEFCQALLRRFGRPLVSTSANISGEATPLRFSEISQEVIDGADLIMKERFEGRPTRKPSSIISLGAGGEIKIVRE